MVDQNSQFYAILTNVGAAKQANADALGVPWKITQMAVGDANGTDPTPNATQTSLLNEWRRAPLNQLKVDDKDPAIIVAEQVIPADVGGHWIREIALYDADGDMVAVANCAPTYKPLLSQGSGRTQVVRMNLVVSSSSNVQLKVDPSVVLATREFVLEELARQDFKHTVLAATTAAINLSGLQTVDGVALTAGARVLVKNQDAAKDNGLYTVVAGSAWTRCTDADSAAKVTPGLLVLVERGTVNADSAWQLVTDAPITLGVTGLAFEMAFGRTGVAVGTYRSVQVDANGRVLAGTNPTTVAGYGLTDVYTKTQVDAALAFKAPLASPALTGVPTAPTPAKGTNTSQLATTAFVLSEVLGLVDSAPGALDTLKELAAALGNDPNFSTTVLSELAKKAPLDSPAFSGKPVVPMPPAGARDAQAVSALWVAQELSRWGIGTDNMPDVVNTDLKTMFTGGQFFIGSGCTGLPPGTAYGYLDVLPNSGNEAIQKFYSGSKAWRRFSTAGVYSTWDEQPSKAVVDAAIKVISDALSTKADGQLMADELSKRLLVGGVSQQRPRMASPTNTGNWDSTALEIREVQQVGEWAPDQTGEQWGPAIAFHWAGKYGGKLHMDVTGVLKWQGRPLATLDSPIFTGLPRADTPPGGDESTRLATTAFVQGTVRNTALLTLGMGQSWQDVKAWRALSTTYTNSTGRPIAVTVTGSIAAGVSLTAVVNGVVAAMHFTNAGYATPPFLAFIVPPGHAYSVNGTGGITISAWSELR
ncbi:Phage-related tail fiber protein-like protein [Pseudomonas sp. CCOS 191]|nr:phage tail protein [Pseudomonas sp. CCOS 191]CRI58060.1 Phage-related tail fiber protein-like protein [Pseudomonas sp. CCOS 191]